MPSQMLSASVGHYDVVSDALAVVLGEAPGEAAVLGAVARGVLGGHARELPEEAGGVWAYSCIGPWASASGPQ